MTEAILLISIVPSMFYLGFLLAKNTVLKRENLKLKRENKELYNLSRTLMQANENTQREKNMIEIFRRKLINSNYFNEN